MRFDDIHDGILTELINASLGYPIAYENVSYTPTVGQAYLEFDYAPSSTTIATMGMGGYDLYEGFAQITINAPSSKGTAAYSELADTIGGIFNRGLINYNGITIKTRVERAKGFKSGDFYKMPITIYFQSKF